MSTSTSNNSQYGFTDSRGEWRPGSPISFAPVFVWPPQITKFLVWLFNYLFTWNLIYLGIVLLSYRYLQPPLEEMKTFKFSWIALIFIRNMTLVWIIYGGWHLYLYQLKKRGSKAKYCPRWQNTNGSTFLWNDQVYDNVFWACASAVPIWTAYEVLTFWMYANHKIPYIDFREHPIWFVVLFLLIPFWRELHFYLIHRLIHWNPLYKRIHYLHHYNINPGPWSGLAMHPIEHLLYFSVVLIHWLVPSHPLHFLFNSQHTALTPAPGHSGFEGKVFKYLTFGSYFHYLHHRLFECNYGESTIPLDKWFGIFENGAQTQTEKNEMAATYQQLKVTQIVTETPEVKSFYLTSPCGSDLNKNTAGQHLTFRIPFKEKELALNNDDSNTSDINYALRSYTISNNTENNQYQISVKKETDGRVSKALHNSLKVGDILEAKGPKGMFVLKASKKKPLVFIAAGIGITPILSMLRSLKKSNKELFLILAVKEYELLPFKGELQDISAQHNNIQTHLFLSKQAISEIENQNSKWYFHKGRLNIDSLKTILPRKNFNFYICGPNELNKTLSSEIEKWTKGKSTVHTETFGVENVSKNSFDVNKTIQVHFTKSGKTARWDAEHLNILEFAESNGISLQAGCMFGECGACSTRINSGEVAYNINTAFKPANGICLPCSCHPTTDIYLDA